MSLSFWEQKAKERDQKRKNPTLKETEGFCIDCNHITSNKFRVVKAVRGEKDPVKTINNIEVFFLCSHCDKERRVSIKEFLRNHGIE